MRFHVPRGPEPTGAAISQDALTAAKLPQSLIGLRAGVGLIISAEQNAPASARPAAGSNAARMPVASDCLINVAAISRSAHGGLLSALASGRGRSDALAMIADPATRHPYY